MDKQGEVLVIRGYLDRAGRFTLRRSRSTHYVRQWPVVEKSEVTVELLDIDGIVLHREPAEIKRDTTCDPGAARRFRVLACIELREGAASVRLQRAGEIALWQAPIPAEPTLKISLETRRVGTDRRVRLKLRYSVAGADAHLTLVYQWGPRRFRPVYIGKPSETMTLDLRDMPGGRECRVVASYSNGLRSAQAATPVFEVPRVGPSVTIMQPERGFEHIAGTPLTLAGTVRDEERAGGAVHEALVWSIDGVEVGRGLVTSVDALRVGRHRINLEYRVEPGAQAAMSVLSRASKVPSASEWPTWDPV